MQRFFVALHATLPAALVVAVLVHLWGPAWLPALAQRPIWTVWVFVAVWLLMSALAAWALRPLALWRICLGGAGLLMLAAGGVGLAHGAALALAMLAGMAVLGLLCGGVAAFIGPARVQAHKRRAPRQGPANHAGTTPPPHPAGRKALGRWVPAAAHLPFWLAGLLAVESFRLAHIVATEPARSSGMLGLLLTFFVALPAATLRAWAPRTAALLWALAALAFGGLAAKAGLAQWAVAAAACGVAAFSGLALLQRLRRTTQPHRPPPHPPHNPQRETA